VIFGSRSSWENARIVLSCAVNAAPAHSDRRQRRAHGTSPSDRRQHGRASQVAVLGRLARPGRGRSAAFGQERRRSVSVAEQVGQLPTAACVTSKERKAAPVCAGVAIPA